MSFVSHAAAEAAPCFAGLFPLPLTIFETFMLADARPGYPMMCDLELHFEGSIDRAAFDAGLAFGISRNPLLRAIVSEDQPRQLEWRLVDAMPLVDWAPLGTPRGPRYDEYVDLREQTGLRIWVRQGSDRSTLLLHFHHACCDGLGAFAFIEDFLVGYAAASGQGSIAIARPLVPQRLKMRQDFGVDTRSLYRRTADWLIGVREGGRFFLQSPWPLPSCRQPSASGCDSDQPGFISQALSPDSSAGLRRSASSSGVTVNDILLRDLFRTLRDWSRTAGQDPGRRHLRILMPHNLRQREDRAMPAANVMSFAFLTRPASDCDRAEELLRSIHQETELTRRYRLTLYFLGSMGFVQSTGYFEWLMRRQFCFTTAVLTNLGNPTRRFVARLPRAGMQLEVGNLLLKEMTGGPPVRPLTRAVFSIFNNPQHLSISLKCDAGEYTSQDAGRLLNAYLARLQETAGAAEDGSQQEEPDAAGGT